MKSIQDKDILFVMRRWSCGRGAHTSVERFVDYFPESQKIIGKPFKRPYFFWKWIAGRAKTDAYTSYNAGLEFRAILEMMKLRPKVVLFLYGDYDYFFCAPWAHAIGAKVASWSYFSQKEIEERFGRKDHLNRLDLLLAAGSDQINALSRYVGADKLRHLPLGVDCEYFTPSQTKQESIRLLQVGVNRRDLKLAVKVCEQLKQRYKTLQADFIGNFYHCRDQMPDCDWLNVHQGVTDEVLRDYYQQATLLLLPLSDGGSSNSLNEALACGLPVVATRIENAQDYLDVSYSCSVEKGDVTGMVEACVQIIENKTLRESMGKQARAAAIQYDWPVIKDKLYDIMKERFIK